MLINNHIRREVREELRRLGFRAAPATEDLIISAIGSGRTIRTVAARTIRGRAGSWRDRYVRAAQARLDALVHAGVLQYVDSVRGGTAYDWADDPYGDTAGGADGDGAEAA